MVLATSPGQNVARHVLFDGQESYSVGSVVCVLHVFTFKTRLIGYASRGRRLPALEGNVYAGQPTALPHTSAV